jgi:hypothetical protein
MSEWLDRLAGVLPPPASPNLDGVPLGPEGIDWARVTDDLGFAPPTEYRQFVERYGQGEIDWLCAIAVPGVELLGFADRWLRHYRDEFPVLQESNPPPAPYYPADPAVFPFANENGGEWYWIVSDAAADDSTIWINGDLPWTAYEGPLTRLLWLVCSHQIPIPGFDAVDLERSLEFRPS